MSDLRTRRPSPALVLASVALVLALAGTGYAATALPTNSVSATQLKRNSVASAEVRDRSLTQKDFRDPLRGAKGPTGPAGATGATGVAGARGADGAKGRDRDRGRAAAAADAPGPYTFTATTEATGAYVVGQQVPSSAVVVTASLDAALTRATVGFVEGRCKLALAGNSDIGVLDANDETAMKGTIAMQLAVPAATVAASDRTASVTCWEPNGDLVVTDARVTALPVSSVDNAQFP